VSRAHGLEDHGNSTGPQVHRGHGPTPGAELTRAHALERLQPRRLAGGVERQSGSLGDHYSGVGRWRGSAVCSGGGKEAVATLGPHRISVLGCEGVMFMMEMGAGWNGGAHGRFI
jgi:hypothetical protein